jgi:hypothetical protein
MKINFLHPVTKKPSSVIVSDTWVSVFSAAHCIAPGDVDLRRQVNSCANLYYAVPNGRMISPEAKTFTQFVEARVALSVRAAFEVLRK